MKTKCLILILFFHYSSHQCGQSAHQEQKRERENKAEVRFGFGLPNTGIMSRYISNENKKIAIKSLKFAKCKSLVQVIDIIGNISFTSTSDAKINFNISVASTINSVVKGRLTILKNMFGAWIKIPCMNGVGSCRYADLCAFGMDKCPVKMLQENKLPCSCPIEKGIYSIQNDVVALPIFPNGHFISGQYKFQILLQNHENKMLACYNGTVVLGIPTPLQ